MMSSSQTDWVVPEDPELVATVANVLSIGCGKQLPGRGSLVIHCDRVYRCEQCQTKLEGIGHVRLLNIIDALNARNRMLMGIVKGLNSHLQA